MSEIARTCQADLILAPFLTKTVPEDVYANPRTPCIIVHPGIEGDRGRHSLDWVLYQRQAEWGVTLLQAVEEMDAGKWIEMQRTAATQKKFRCLILKFLSRPE